MIQTFITRLRPVKLESLMIFVLNGIPEINFTLPQMKYLFHLIKYGQHLYIFILDCKLNDASFLSSFDK